MDRTIIDFLNDYVRKADGGIGQESSDAQDRLISFHMPGHKGRTAIYERTGYGDILRNVVTCDITEIPGADALFCPETTIRAVMDNYAEQYGAKHTELLVNGSSSGVISAVIGSVPVGGKLILGRNSHHSAFSALRLGGINPVYVRPKTDPRSGLVGEMLPSELRAACEANPDASAVLVASPNYYGMLSDIAALASVAHEYGMILIVDQAHGAHLRFFDRDAEDLAESGIRIPFPRHSAEALGADIVINSTHKTLLSFTGSGIMNICTDNVDIPSVSDALRMIQTTSPSYILMASLDINERIMRKYGSRIVKAWREDLTTFYRRALRIPGLSIAGLRPEDAEMVSTRTAAQADGTGAAASPQDTGCSFPMYFNRSGLDMTKINISMASAGISGARLERELRTRGIIAEMVHGDYVMLMSGAGNRSSDYSRLLDVLWELSDSYGVVDKSPGVRRQDPRTVDDFALDVTTVPFETEYVPLYSADGKVLGDPVIIYPPGTPVACPGEILTVDVISFISDAIGRGEKVTGVDDEGMIRVEADHQ